LLFGPNSDAEASAAPQFNHLPAMREQFCGRMFMFFRRDFPKIADSRTATTDEK
jgi:hypothetical protein